MPVVVAVLRESAEGERRVALTPEVAKKLKARGAQIVIEKSAAASAYFADSAFADAEVVADGPAALAKADVLLRVQPPTAEEISHLKPGAIVIADLNHRALDFIARPQPERHTLPHLLSQNFTHPCRCHHGRARSKPAR